MRYLWHQQASTLASWGIKHADSAAWKNSDPDSVESIARLFMQVRGEYDDFKIWRCSGFDGEKFRNYLDAPSLVYTLQKFPHDYTIEIIDRMQDVTGLKDLCELALKIKLGRFKHPSQAVGKIFPFDGCV